MCIINLLLEYITDDRFIVTIILIDFKFLVQYLFNCVALSAFILNIIFWIYTQ